MKFFIAATLLFTLSLCFSQDVEQDSQLYRCHIAKGNVLYGYIVNESIDSITLDVPNVGTLTFSKDHLESIVAYDGFHSYSPARALTYKDNYFFSDNAFTPKAGSMYIQNQDLFFNRFTLAFSDHIAMEAGAIIEPFDGSFAGFIGAKASYSISKNIHLGLKAQFIGSDEDDKYTINSGIVTFGNVHNNFSLGLHQVNYSASYSEETKGEKKFLYSVSGMVELSQKSAFKFEHISFGNRESMLNFGFSYNTRSLSFTYGIILYSDDNDDYYDDFKIPFPLLGLKIPLRK
jgi:hypothetical protein